jgi:hypothetical protein
MIPGWNSLVAAKQVHVIFQIGALTFFALLVFFEVLAHRAKNDAAKEGRFGKWALIFFAIAILGEVGAFAYSRRAETLSDAELDKRDAFVAILTKQLKDAATPKPIGERVRTFLNSLDPGFLQKLTNGPVHAQAYLTGFQRDEFDRLLAQLGSEQYITRLPQELDMQRMYNDGSTKYGATFLVSTNVLKSSN